MFSIVTNPKIANYLKNSKFFRRNLGLVNTIEKNGERIYNERDKFSYFYNNQYKTTIYGVGNIGDIMIYIDYYIKDDVLAVYYIFEEYIFTFDENLIKEKGTDFYIGHVLKELDEKHEERTNKPKEEVEIKEGNPDVLLNNPGNVSYEDIQAYLKKKQAERFNLGNS